MSKCVERWSKVKMGPRSLGFCVCVGVGGCFVLMRAVLIERWDRCQMSYSI